jgi:release factor glutamine methyltransferase
MSHSPGQRPRRATTVLPLPATGSTAAALVADLARILDRAAIPDARAEARDLVAALVDEPRFWPSLHPEALVSDEVVARGRAAAMLRARGAPFAYAVGRAAFRHLVLAVDQRVLIPRQETEVLVDLVLRARAGIAGGVIADIGTGSGALALALAAEGAFDRVIATDLSSGALRVAHENARALAGRLQARVEFRCGAGVAPLRGESVDVLVSNPPYIAAGETRELPALVRDWEPVAALMAGADGLAVIRDIIRDAPSVLAPGGLLALEVDSRRARTVADLVNGAEAFGDVSVRRDLTGRDRFVLATRA